MKNFIAGLFLIGTLFVSTNSYAQVQEDSQKVVLSKAEDLVFDTQNGEEIVYDKDGNPYFGAVVLPDEENRRVTYFYENGKKQGVAVSKFFNGNIEFETTYVNGKKNGIEMLFFSNKNPKYKRNYKDDLLDGEEILYKNGKPRQVNYYVDGKLNGLSTYYNDAGEPVKTETYKDGKKNGPVRIIENNKLLEEIDYVDDKREGLYKTYSSEGSRHEVPYKNDKKEGEGRIYSANNIIIESAIYSNDKRNGLYRKFSALNGRLVSAENYKNDIKDGVSRYYDADGKLNSVSYYIDGVELSQLQISKRSDLVNIQDAVFEGKLSRYSNKKNLWYKILWLALNLNKPEVLHILKKEMRMYAADIDNIGTYKRWSGSLFDSENKQLFFGLSPLDYAINVEASTDVLQEFVSQIQDKNSRGLSPLRDAVRLNKTEIVKFLILNGADLKEKDNEGNDILLYAIINESPNEIIQTIIDAGVRINTMNDVYQTPLTVALAQNNVELVKMLIEAGADTQKMPDGQNLLFYAYDKKAPLDVINVLVDDGFDVNSTDNEGSNLLLKALKNNDENTAMFALERGADINQKDNEGETAVSYILFNKVSPKISEKILSMDYDFESKLEKQNKMIWKVFMEQGKLDLLKKTWDKMPDISSTPDAMGEIPLKIALRTANNPDLHKLALSYLKQADPQMVWGALIDKDFGLFRHLLAKGTDVNYKNADGDSMLIYVIKNRYDNAYIDLILSKDIDVNAENNRNQTALDIVIKKGNYDMMHYLLSKGANPNREVNGETYLSAARPSQEKISAILLQYTKKLEPTLSNGESLLMRAVKNLNLPLFEYMAKQKDTDFTITDEEGNTLLLSCADYFEHPDAKDDAKVLSKNFKEIVKALLEKGADINSRNDNGETLLIKLAKYCGSGYDELAEFLVENGANAGLKDQFNNTASDYRNGHVNSD